MFVKTDIDNPGVTVNSCGKFAAPSGRQSHGLNLETATPVVSTIYFNYFLLNIRMFRQVVLSYKRLNLVAQCLVSVLVTALVILSKKALYASAY
jgi:hypothetical protein